MSKNLTIADDVVESYYRSMLIGENVSKFIYTPQHPMWMRMILD